MFMNLPGIPHSHWALNACVETAQLIEVWGPACFALGWVVHCELRSGDEARDMLTMALQMPSDLRLAASSVNCACS